MRKVFASAVIWLALGVMSAVSAQMDMSVGGSVFYAGDGGFYGVKTESGSNKSWQTLPWGGFGFGGFFDATYAEASVSLIFGGGKDHFRQEDDNGRAWGVSKKDGVSFTSLNIGVLGKYPIALAENITVFPAAGIDYALVLGATRKQGGQTAKASDPIGDFSAFWLKFGGGLDYGLTDKLYIRPEILWGIRFANSAEGDMVKGNSNADPALGHGWTVKAGVGYKL